MIQRHNCDDNDGSKHTTAIRNDGLIFVAGFEAPVLVEMDAIAAVRP